MVGKIHCLTATRAACCATATHVAQIDCDSTREFQTSRDCQRRSSDGLAQSLVNEDDNRPDHQEQLLAEKQSRRSLHRKIAAADILIAGETSRVLSVHDLSLVDDGGFPGNA